MRRNNLSGRVLAGMLGTGLAACAPTMATMAYAPSITSPADVTADDQKGTKKKFYSALKTLYEATLREGAPNIPGEWSEFVCLWYKGFPAGDRIVGVIAPPVPPKAAKNAELDRDIFVLNQTTLALACPTWLVPGPLVLDTGREYLAFDDRTYRDGTLGRYSDWGELSSRFGLPARDLSSREVYGGRPTDFRQEITPELADMVREAAVGYLREETAKLNQR